jgi:hypothetical protein
MRPPLSPGWIAAIRLAKDNIAVLDYVLLPITREERQQIRFSERVRIQRQIGRFETPDALVYSLIRRVTKANRASATKLVQSKRPPTASLSKNRKALARH